MADVKHSVYPILLAGGTGTRLWPVSRSLYPKQLVKFIGNDSLVQSTVKRLAPVLDLQNVRVVCGQEHFHEIARHVEDIGLTAEDKIISEPSGRNTAPAILLAACHIRYLDPDGLLCIFPADHVIADLNAFHERLQAAIRLAHAGHLVTFGIKPGYPETGYGYIEGGTDVAAGALAVKRFVEKPDRATAEKYIQAGNFFWNSGMFAFKASVILEEFKALQPQMLALMEDIFSAEKAIARKDYDRLENISIDYAIMEKTDNCVVLPSDFGWSDIGSWKSLYDFLEKDGDHNVIDGDVITHDTRNCFLLGHDRLIATNRLKDLVVVETPDSVFVSDLEHSRDVKTIVSELKQKGRKEFRQHRSLHLPWGVSRLLEQRDSYTATELRVYNGATLQLPGEPAATQHFVVARGRAKVICATKQNIVEAGQSFNPSADDGITIENADAGDLYIVHVRIN